MSGLRDRSSCVLGTMLFSKVSQGWEIENRNPFASVSKDFPASQLMDGIRLP